MEKVYAVGLGPGDHEMMTLKAKRILEEADTIFVNGGKVFNGFEGIKNILDKIGCGDKLSFIEMPQTDYKNSRESHIAYFAGEILKHLNKSKKIACVTMGDPSVYSSYPDVYEALKKHGVELKAVSGIPSFLAPSALTGNAIAEFNERAALIPGPENYKDIEKILESFKTVLIMKITDNGKTIKEYIDNNSPSLAVAVFNAYNENQKIYDLKKNFPEGENFYMCVVMIKK